MKASGGQKWGFFGSCYSLAGMVAKSEEPGPPGFLVASSMWAWL